MERPPFQYLGPLFSDVVVISMRAFIDIDRLQHICVSVERGARLYSILMGVTAPYNGEAIDCH